MNSPASLPTWRYLGALLRYRWQAGLGLAGLFALFSSTPVIIGLLEKLVFDSLTHRAAVGLGLWELLVLMVVVQGLGNIVMIVSVFADTYVGFSVGALLRKNMMLHVLRQPGARAIPSSPG